MAKEPAEEKEAGSGRSPVMMAAITAGVIGFASGGLGYAFFTFMPGMSGGDESAEVEEVEEVPPAFLPFGEVVVNLGDARMSRYLRISVALQVNGNDTEQATADMEANRAILRNWLLGYLSDLQMEDIRGAVGQNRIRREIQNRFNEILAPDGTDFVQDVLFEEFNVQ